MTGKQENRERRENNKRELPNRKVRSKQRDHA